MSRYEIVKRNEEIRYQKECPLLIVSSAITKDTQTGKVLAQIKFRNIVSKKLVLCIFRYGERVLMGDY